MDNFSRWLAGDSFVQEVGFCDSEAVDDSNKPKPSFVYVSVSLANEKNATKKEIDKILEETRKQVANNHNISEDKVSVGLAMKF